MLLALDLSVAQCVTGIAKWSLDGPCAMSELKSGSLVVQRCLCCLLGMCVFLLCEHYSTVERLGACSVTCSSEWFAGWGFAGLFLIIKNKSIFSLFASLRVAQRSSAYGA